MNNSEAWLIVQNIEKTHFVWFEDEWHHDGILHCHEKGQLLYVEAGFSI